MEAKQEKRKIGVFWLNKMQLRGEGEQQVLEIELVHAQTLQMFDVAVGLQRIKQHQNFGGFFDSLEQFKDAFNQHFDDLLVTEQGSIIYRQRINKKYLCLELQGTKRQINNNLIKYTNEKLQSRIMDLQAKLITLIDQKTGQLAKTQNQIVLRFSQRDEEISKQLDQLRLKHTKSDQKQTNKLNTTNDYLQQLKISLSQVYQEIIDIQKYMVSMIENSIKLETSQSGWFSRKESAQLQKMEGLKKKLSLSVKQSQKKLNNFNEKFQDEDNEEEEEEEEDDDSNDVHSTLNFPHPHFDTKQEGDKLIVTKDKIYIQKYLFSQTLQRRVKFTKSRNIQMLQQRWTIEEKSTDQGTMTYLMKLHQKNRRPILRIVEIFKSQLNPSLFEGTKNSLFKYSYLCINKRLQ